MVDAHVSVFDAIDGAFHRTKTILFAPFDLEKWLVVGFCAFLATLEQGGGVGFPGHFPGSHPSRDAGFDRMAEWVGAHLALVLTLGSLALLTALAVGIVLQWLGSRGQFMFLDNVAGNRAAVAEPWNRYRRQGNSLFVFRLVLGLGFLALMAAVALAVLALIWGSVRAHHLTAGAIAVLAAAALVVVPLVLAYALLTAILRDFVVPVMARRDLGAVQALRVFRTELLPGRLGTFIVYYLMALVFGLAAATLLTLGTCMTCCIAGLPYVSSVVFLPVWVFFRAFSLCLLGQFGPEWDLFGPAPPAQAGPTPERSAGLPTSEPGPPPAAGSDGPPPEPVGQEGVPPREDGGRPILPE